MMQNSLFYDYYGLIDSCPFLKKYDALFRAFDLIYDQPDFPELGRRGYRRSAYFKALIYKQSAHIKCISDLVRDLESRPILAEMCGFNPGRIPDASRFSRFLTDTNNAEIETLFHASGKLLVEKGIATLDVIMADSKPIKANTKHNNPKNPNRKLDKTTKIKRNPMATLSYYSYIVADSDHVFKGGKPLFAKKRVFTSASLIISFLRLGSRTFVYGTRHSGARAWVLALCHAFLTGKAVLPHAATPIPGVVLYFHQDQDSISDILMILKRKENFDHRESNSGAPLILQEINSPMFIRYPLRIAALNQQSQSDATGFIEILNESASAFQTRLPKLMVLDSVLSPLANFPHELRTLLDALEKTDGRF